MRIVIEVEPVNGHSQIPVVGSDDVTFCDTEGYDYTGTVLEVGTVAAPSGGEFADATNKIVDGVKYLLGRTDGDVVTVGETVNDLVKVAAAERRASEEEA